MRTEKQIQASRTNGTLSQGPITPEGKLNSSRNSTRHGMLAATVVLHEESADRFLDLLREFMEEYQPRTATQVCLVETMAAARWRLLRIWGAQKTSVDLGMVMQNPSSSTPPLRLLNALRPTAQDACPPELLLRYEVSFDRQFNRALSRLMALQSLPAKPGSAAYIPSLSSMNTWPTGMTWPATPTDSRNSASPNSDPANPEPAPVTEPEPCAAVSPVPTRTPPRPSSPVPHPTPTQPNEPNNPLKTQPRPAPPSQPKATCSPGGTTPVSTPLFARK